MNYAVIKTGGKQYRVKSNDIIHIESLNAKDDEKITFSEVLLLAVDGKMQVGNPILKNAKITATVLKSTRGEKIRVSKYKAKAKYRRVRGHRQSLVQVKIDQIGGKEKETPAPKTLKETKTSVKKAQAKTAK